MTSPDYLNAMINNNNMGQSRMMGAQYLPRM